MKKPNEAFMRCALSEARKNLRTIQGGPFGACIVKGGRILSVAHNTVLKHDATCHAEINAIRLAAKKLRTYDLSGCQIYSTTEPCPMCFSAVHWAGIDTIVYGTSIADVQKRGFRELPISNKRLKALAKSRIKLYPRFLYLECEKLLQDWDTIGVKRLY